MPPTPTTPPLPVSDLLQDLIDAGIVDPAALTSLLGVRRNDATLNDLELALVRGNVLSRDTLLARKAALTGLPAYPDKVTGTTRALPPNVASQAGAIALDTPTPVVAMVETTAENLNLVAQALGTTGFKVAITTAPHFADLHQATYSGVVTQRDPEAPDLYTVLDHAVRDGASDVHLKVGVPPKLRVDGSIRPLPYAPLDQQWMRAAIEQIAGTRHQEDLARKFSCDFAYTFGAVRFRVNAARDAEGYTMVLRRLPVALPTMDDLNLPDPIRAMAGLERGLVLVTGPTGSGKSTTLAAILNEVVRTSSRHVITLEDPIEFRFPSDTASLVNQRELGSSFASFPDGIRDALRQDPDVMLVGEMRDLETMRAALELADTGHLVFATLHTSSAPATVQRVVSRFPADEQDAVRVQLAQQLKGCISQTLLPRATGRGRVAAFEILLNNAAVQANLRKVDGLNQLRQTMQTHARAGMCTMEMSLARLVHAGVVTEAEALFRAQDVEEFRNNLRFLSSTSR
jgi:twitching motility protein PilT